MGYYSTLEGAHSFRTWCRSDSDIRKVFETCFGGHAELQEIDDLGYDLVLRKEKDGHYIDLESDEYTQKHYYADELADLIKGLIERGARTYLIFTGEEGEKYGYAITSEGTHCIEFVCRVNGQLLDEWMDSAA